ncbi:MAG: Crp/Fnr family transcriptional regulator [Eubacteriales bacterium]|jgi:CRP/FNR family transcriptional regulator
MNGPAVFLPFYNKLDGRQKEILISSIQSRHFSKGDIIHQGGDCEGLIVVASGRIRVYALSDEGKEITLYRLLERDICLFSASCIMPSLQFEVLANAETETDAFIIPASVYKSLMAESAVVANYTNNLLASRFSDVMWLFDQILNKKLDTRLAAFLIEESQLNDSNTLKLTHEDIANHLGSIREVITRMLKYFAAEGLVSLGRGKITLVDVQTLSDLAKDSLK